MEQGLFKPLAEDREIGSLGLCKGFTKPFSILDGNRILENAALLPNHLLPVHQNGQQPFLEGGEFLVLLLIIDNLLSGRHKNLPTLIIPQKPEKIVTKVSKQLQSVPFLTKQLQIVCFDRNLVCPQRLSESGVAPRRGGILPPNNPGNLTSRNPTPTSTYIVCSQRLAIYTEFQPCHKRTFHKD